MKTLVALVTALSLLTIGSFAHAQTPAPAASPAPSASPAATPAASPAATEKGKGKGKGKGNVKASGKAFMGKVTAIGNGSITVNNPTSGDRTFKLTADTKFGKPGAGKNATVGDIKVDDMVHVKIGATEDTAEKVSVMGDKKKPEKKKNA